MESKGTLRQLWECAQLPAAVPLVSDSVMEEKLSQCSNANRHSEHSRGKGNLKVQMDKIKPIT